MKNYFTFSLLPKPAIIGFLPSGNNFLISANQAIFKYFLKLMKIIYKSTSDFFKITSVLNESTIDSGDIKIGPAGNLKSFY